MATRRSFGFGLILLVTLAGCGGGASPSAATSPGGGGTASEAPAAGSAPAAGEGTVQGSIVSSGPYEATWTWQAGNAVNTGSFTLNSDKGTFGNLTVLPTGDITFTSGAPELSAASPFSGTGGQVTMSQADIPDICGISVDNDLTGSDGSTIHLKGQLTVIGTITTEGTTEC